MRPKSVLCAPKVHSQFQPAKKEHMEKYLFSAEQLKQLIEKSIDLFLKYQYGHGYEEPMAKSAAVMDVMGSLKAIGKNLSEER